MDLEKRKLTIIEKFINLQDIDIISQVEKLLNRAKAKNEDGGFQSMSIDEFNNRIEKSMNDSRNGRLTRNDDMLSKIEKWD